MPESYKLSTAVIETKMAQFVGWYNTEVDQLNPTELAAKVHADFVGIHPFIDEFRIDEGRLSAPV